MLALVVDDVIGVEDCSDHEIVASDTGVTGLDGVKVLTRSNGEMVILHNPDLLPDLNALMQLETAISESRILQR